MSSSFGRFPALSITLILMWIKDRMDNIAATLPLDEPKVRDRLLAAAIRLFTEKGYAATSVSEIVAAAGVTKPILYYYFKNKEGIYLEIIQSAYGRLEHLLNETPGWSGPAAARLTRLGGEILTLFVENLAAARLIHAIYYGPPQGAPVYDYDAHHDRYLATIKAIVEDGLARGEFKPLNPEDITLGVAGMIAIAMDMQLCDRGLPVDRERLSRLLEIFFSGVVVEERTRPQKP